MEWLVRNSPWRTSSGQIPGSAWSDTCRPSRPNGWTRYWPQTARRCLAETGGAGAPLGADSSGTETARYEDVERPDKDAREFAEKPPKGLYWKYHITAVPGLQIILTAMATPGNVNDVNMLVPMPDEMSDAADSSSRTASFTPTGGTVPSTVPG